MLNFGHIQACTCLIYTILRCCCQNGLTLSHCPQPQFLSQVNATPFQSTFLLIRLPVCPFVHSPVCPSIRFFVCLSVYSIMLTSSVFIGTITYNSTSLNCLGGLLYPRPCPLTRDWGFRVCGRSDRNEVISRMTRRCSNQIVKGFSVGMVVNEYACI